MIIDFTVKNYLSMKDEITLSFVSNSKENNEDSRSHTIPIENDKYRIFPFCAIYGPNASGKSNIIKAMKDFVDYILSSHKLDLDGSIPAYKPFRLDKANLDKPVYFEMEFVVDNVRYNYLISFNKFKVLEEKLIFYPNGPKKTIYHRLDGEKIMYGSAFTGEKKSVESSLLQNRLLLSVSANSSNDFLKPIYRFFRDLISIYVTLDSSQDIIHLTTILLRTGSDEFRKSVYNILKFADLSINEIKLVENNQSIESLNGFSADIREKLQDTLKFKPFFGHKVFNNGLSTDEVDFFDLDTDESTGTVKMYDMASYIVTALNKGTILIMDEFNSGLHPLLGKFLVELFINPETNVHKAQLLVATHDTCVLDSKLLKREQIWFTDRNKYGVTELYSLNEFDKNAVRDNAKYGKQYLEGRFKAIPTTSLNDFMEISHAKD